VAQLVLCVAPYEANPIERRHDGPANHSARHIPEPSSHAPSAPPLRPLRRPLRAAAGRRVQRGIARQRVMLTRTKTRIRQMIAAAVRPELEYASRSIEFARARRLADEAASFIEDHMEYAVGYRSRYDLLCAALGQVTVQDGLFCEFGVYQGRTINFIASKTTADVHGFDSFDGLPEDWRPGVMRGAFRTGRLPAVRDNVRLHQGWFDETLPIFAREHTGPLAFMHVDCDLYSSTRLVFDVLGCRIVPGTVIQFDEFFNYTGWRQGEYKAFMELCEARRLKARYLGYTLANTPAQIALSVVAVG
jgi:hypothetical protein